MMPDGILSMLKILNYKLESSKRNYNLYVQYYMQIALNSQLNVHIKKMHKYIS
jgi:hypothetical protein